MSLACVLAPRGSVFHLFATDANRSEQSISRFGRDFAKVLWKNHFFGSFVLLKAVDEREQLFGNYNCSQMKPKLIKRSHLSSVNLHRRLGQYPTHLKVTTQ